MEKNSDRWFVAAKVDGKTVNATVSDHPTVWAKNHISNDVVISFYDKLDESATAQAIIEEDQVVCAPTLYIVTGGLGFIGHNFIKNLYDRYDNDSLFHVINIDADTYASSPTTKTLLGEKSNYDMIEADIAQPGLGKKVLSSVKKLSGYDNFDWYSHINMVHFAAESHVDNSISNSAPFMITNVVGTARLIDTAMSLGIHNRDNFLFVHISTDEVYGDLSSTEDPPFNEKTPYNPSSPYSASKASSDHVVSSYVKTHGLKAIITHCTNNYGRGQHIEKLIPKAISMIVKDKKVPMYGDPSRYYRNWIHTLDFCDGIYDICIVNTTKYQLPPVINFASNTLISNKSLMIKICSSFIKCGLGSRDGLKTKFDAITSLNLYNSCTEGVKDRLAHDRVYNMGYLMAERHLRWEPRRSIDGTIKGLVHTAYKNEVELRKRFDNISGVDARG